MQDHKVMLRYFWKFAAAALAFLLLMSPQIARAGGPPLPPSIFQPPVVPTAQPLPTSTPTIPKITRPPASDSAPSNGEKLFLPLLALPPVQIAAQTEPATNPMVDSFVYQVRPGDTLTSLAMEFGRDTKTMHCVRTRAGDEVSALLPGQQIVIPALSDLCHRVKKGQTVAFVADWYGIAPDDLLAVPANHLDADTLLRPGQTLLIPNARSRYQQPDELNLPHPSQTGWRYGDGKFIWPLPQDSFWISQRFKHGKHMATDMAAPLGTPVYAIDTGTIIKAGWSDIGYGYRVIIDHGIDYVSLYAHLSRYVVQPGDIVQKGDIIGYVGSTGNSTGPHLHLEIRDYGYLIDPLLVLPSK
jgi:murein DD-endopeptidase MepM/ murein hydrolase activator NlpD